MREWEPNMTRLEELAVTIVVIVLAIFFPIIYLFVIKRFTDE